jgi:hypothetical protein
MKRFLFDIADRSMSEDRGNAMMSRGSLDLPDRIPHVEMPNHTYS